MDPEDRQAAMGRTGIAAGTSSFEREEILQ